MDIFYQGDQLCNIQDGPGNTCKDIIHHIKAIIHLHGKQKTKLKNKITNFLQYNYSNSLKEIQQSKPQSTKLILLITFK